MVVGIARIAPGPFLSGDRGPLSEIGLAAVEHVPQAARRRGGVDRGRVVLCRGGDLIVTGSALVAFHCHRIIALAARLGIEFGTD